MTPRRSPARSTMRPRERAVRPHLTAERFRLSAGFDAAHVPFKGSSDALTEVIANRMDFYCSPVNAAIELIKGGQIQSPRVSSSKRASALPDVRPLSRLAIGFGI